LIISNGPSPRLDIPGDKYFFIQGVEGTDEGEDMDNDQ
jgi:hypothetical protein